MKIYDGVGIAAPQVGVPLRIFAVNAPPPRLRPDDDGPPRPLSQGEAALLPMMPLVFINPEIISGSDTLVSYEEGCLSVPDIYADVMRPETIVFQAQILGGAFISLEVGGFLARILQHETDHLNGIVFVDRLEPGKLDGIRSKLDKLKKSGKKKGFLRILEDQS
jgi:peptide deformylase